MRQSRQLGHERFAAYQHSIRFFTFALATLQRIPAGPGHGEVKDQLRRASLSIPLNIAEGSGYAAGGMRRKHYMIARGSALECGALLDALCVMELLDADGVSEGKAHLIQVVSILTKHCLS